jgi:hypothetical protein
MMHETPLPIGYHPLPPGLAGLVARARQIALALQLFQLAAQILLPLGKALAALLAFARLALLALAQRLSLPPALHIAERIIRQALLAAHRLAKIAHRLEDGTHIPSPKGDRSKAKAKSAAPTPAATMAVTIWTNRRLQSQLLAIHAAQTRIPAAKSPVSRLFPCAIPNATPVL